MSSIACLNAGSWAYLKGEVGVDEPHAEKRVIGGADDNRRVNQGGGAMPTPAFLTVEGKIQGLITRGASNKHGLGNKFREGHEDQILVQAYEHRMAHPPSGQGRGPSGNRQHEQVRVLKQTDNSSPLLMMALTHGETLDIELDLYRVGPKGFEEHYFTMEFKQALCTVIEPYMPNCLDEANSWVENMEWVSFCYGGLVWRHEVGRTEAHDEWHTARAERTDDRKTSRW